MEAPAQNHTHSRWLLITAIIFFTAALLAVAGYFSFEMIYRDKIYPGLYLDKTNLGGEKPEQLRDLLNQKINLLNREGIVFFYQDQRFALTPTVAPAGAELAYALIDFDVDKTVEETFFYARSKNRFADLVKKLLLVWRGEKINIIYSMNETETKKILEANFSQFDQPGKDAELVFSPAADAFSVTEEKTGRNLDYSKALKQLKEQLASLNTQTIELEMAESRPLIRKNEVLNANAKARPILDLAPFNLSASSSLATTSRWKIDRTTLAGWLGLSLDETASNNADKVTVGLNRAVVENYLEEKIAPQIEHRPEEAKFEIKNGKVSIFQSGQAGLEIDLAPTLDNIERRLVLEKTNEAELVLKTTPSDTLNPENDLGIKEIIGLGRSNFAGSPKNRRHNIRVGADTLNGVLIEPGETFSLVKTLGDISSSTGYLPELVIKGSRTVPEFGGGLCQIGTTMFRGSLASGLPIIERRNHSYRVQYYEPAGTDATIYDPSPDFKFLNDTGRHILIQSKIVKDNLSFEFWGTADGRVATQTKPVIYNIAKPPPAKIIETLDLAPGTKKCTEKAHNGADAYFNYKVTYPDGKIMEKKFSSHYIPWQEVCLLGVEKISETTDVSGSTSTPAAAPANP